MRQKFDDPRLDIAIHEAGHTVVAYFSGVKIHYSTIRQDGRKLGHTSYTYRIFRSRVVDRISVAGYVAGMMSDSKHFKQSEERRQNYLETSTDDWALVKGSIDKACLIAYEILEEHWYQVEVVAVALLSSPSETLSGREIFDILNKRGD